MKTTLLLSGAGDKSKQTRAIFRPQRENFRDDARKQEEEECFLIKRVQIALKCSIIRLCSVKPFTWRTRIRGTMTRHEKKEIIPNRTFSRDIRFSLMTFVLRSFDKRSLVTKHYMPVRSTIQWTVSNS